MFELLVRLICNYVEVEPENIHPESRFMEDLGFTSFDFMSMLGELEDELDVEIDQKEAADIRTVQEAADYLEKLKAEQSVRGFQITGILLDQEDAGFEFSLREFCTNVYRTSQLSRDQIAEQLVVSRVA